MATTLLNELTYLTTKHGFGGMVARMTAKYGLTSDKASHKETAYIGTIRGVSIRIINGRHNNRNFKKVMTGDGKTILFSA